jgi:HEAT repeat protein
VNQQQAVGHYVAQLSGDDAEDAWHRLVELGPSTLSLVIDAFDSISNSDVRASLVSIVAEWRTGDAVPLLIACLTEKDSEIWKTALDGLVSTGGPEAENALRASRLSCRVDQREWIDEAITQIAEP